MQADNIAFAPYVHQVAHSGTYGHLVHDPQGGLLLRQCGYVDVPTLLSVYRGFLQERKLYHEDVFDPSSLTIHADHIVYGPWKARKIIFCDGASGHQNRFFGWLPFRPVKGEMLRIRTHEEIPLIINRGVFIIPQGTSCNVGSTYDHQDLTSTSTAKGRQTLAQQAGSLIEGSLRDRGSVGRGTTGYARPPSLYRSASSLRTISRF